jgi:hypothetical protein
MVTNISICKNCFEAIHHYTLRTDFPSSERSPRPIVVTHPSRYVSIPFSTMPTYIERPYLTEELRVKLGKRHSGVGLAYAVVVIGLGGTGKT